MGYGFKLEVFGEYALFTRPEFKVERVSYDVITPSAARGIIESIYYKPAIRWVIDKIHVYNEPEFTNIRRNEVKSKASDSDAKKLMRNNGSGKGYIATTQDIQQRASMILKNVKYIIEAHFEVTDRMGQDETIEKHYNIALRRMRKGQFYHMPYMGCREFPANFRLIEKDTPKSTLSGERDLGYMLYDMDYSDLDQIQPMFYRAIMKDGTIDLTDIDVRR
ncbi:MAG: type I-C CRISPR-associated protein Cas5c [Vallitaleaceae bacterium]|nr:type I-C CRISPR-associated protein Cas5c [Vallitaleaceae bacterium]